MWFPRSFFFALLVASAIPALAADKESSPLQLAVRGEKQAVLTRGPYARQFLARAGLLASPEEPRVELDIVPGSTRLLEAGQLVVIPYSDSVCYTMRMYKVKRTERLASGESASRGFSTCELARNFQIRSAVAHERTGEARKAQSQ